jgi:hypothetical protein
MFGCFVVVPALPSFLKSILEEKFMFSFVVVECIVGIAYIRYLFRKARKDRIEKSVETSKFYLELCRMREMKLIASSSSSHHLYWG